MRTPLVLAAMLTLASAGAAQVTKPGGSTFTVASIKPNKSGSTFTAATVPRVGLQPGGRLTARNSTLHEMLVVAFGLLDYQIAGGPDWVRSNRYDIDARADTEFTQDEARSMLRALLIDRFKLATHTAVRDLPIYALVMTRSDRRLGAHLRASGAQCAAPTPPPAAGGAAPPPIPPPPPPPPGQQMTLLNNRWPRPCPMMYAPGYISARAMGMDEFAARLIQFVGRPVLDRSGLRGNFDFELQFTPEFQSPGVGEPLTPSAPSLFTAVQEQLGLKLESERGPVEVLLIDHVERPTEN